MTSIFIESKNDNVLDFEKNIAYFYGAKETDSIANPYLVALQILESLGLSASENELHEKILPHLKAAYLAVQMQTDLDFDVNIASLYEFQLILAQARKDSFEKIYG